MQCVLRCESTLECVLRVLRFVSGPKPSYQEHVLEKHVRGVIAVYICVCMRSDPHDVSGTSVNVYFRCYAFSIVSFVSRMQLSIHTRVQLRCIRLDVYPHSRVFVRGPVSCNIARLVNTIPWDNRNDIAKVETTIVDPHTCAGISGTTRLPL